MNLKAKNKGTKTWEDASVYLYLLVSRYGGLRAWSSGRPTARRAPPVAAFFGHLTLKLPLNVSFANFKEISA